jgi:hypothetical protein
MLHSAEFLKKVLSATLRYATQCEIQANNFLVSSALCCIARSRDFAQCIIGQSHLYMQISLRIRNHMKK